MKAKVFFPLILLALLIAVPQAEAQNKRAERKLKKEMRKLEKQMKKVSELKQDLYMPHWEQSEGLRIIELGKLHELKNLQGDLRNEQREKAMEEAERSRELALRYREQSLEKVRQQQWKAQDQVRKAMEKQKEQMEKMREQYPDGFYFEDIEIPDIDIEIPEMDFEFPAQVFNYKEFEKAFPKGYMEIHGFYESDNNLSINTSLDNESIDKNYNYTVAEDAGYIELKANGSVTQGTVQITIKSPDDKEYQKIELSPAADIDWSQKIKLDEKKEALKGKWTIQAKGENVIGKYALYMKSR